VQIQIRLKKDKKAEDLVRIDRNRVDAERIKDVDCEWSKSYGKEI